MPPQQKASSSLQTAYDAPAGTAPLTHHHVLSLASYLYLTDETRDTLRAGTVPRSSGVSDGVSVAQRQGVDVWPREGSARCS